MEPLRTVTFTRKGAMREQQSSLRRPAGAWRFALVALATVIVLLTGAGLALGEDTRPAPPEPRDTQPPPAEPGADVPNADLWANVTGHWEGAIKLPGVDLQIMLDFDRTSDGDWIGTVDIPMQGAKGLPLSDIVINGDRVDFAISGVPGTPLFKGRANGKKIEGDFSQNGQTFPFSIGREALPKPKRPQEPKPPFPYKAEEVTYQNGDVTFAGTLTIPEGTGPFPAALLITGSGPQNRDEEIFGHKPFAVLADFLSRAGIAVLRVDDRGMGGSTGKSPTVTTEDFAGDAQAGVTFLRTRPEVDRKKIGLIGHSEGGIIAPLVASRSKDVAFIVLLAGTGVPGRDVLLKQTEMVSRAEGMNEEVLKAELAEMRVALDLLVAGADSTAIRAKLEETASGLLAAAPESDKAGIEATARGFRAQLGSMTSPWFRNFVTYDPRPTLRKVKVPVLALNGERDLQVPPEQNLPEIEKALRDAKNKDVTIKKMPGLNHLLQPAKTGAISEYATIETTMDPSALEAVRDWIVQRFVTN
jgi:uncharacterized protein